MSLAFDVREMPISAELIEQYTTGECHIFAAASQIRHGGDFLVAFNLENIHFEMDGDCIYEVLHVFARHQTDEGEIIRDICGDRTNAEWPDLRSELEDMFCIQARNIHLEEMSSDELLSYVSDPETFLAGALGCDGILSPMEDDDRPLCQVTQNDLDTASELPEVISVPGTRPAPRPWDDMCDEYGLDM
jgi:hypothetical protein